MAVSFHLLPPQKLPHPLKFQTIPFPSITLLSSKTKIRISCANGIGDAELPSDLASEVEKINTHLVQREEAMKKSRELLFTELCQHLSVRAEEVKKKWGKMSEEEKWVLVKGFVSEWDVDFHPLSAKSVKELIEEHLEQENPSPNPSSSLLFPGLRKIMGLSPNK